MLDLQLRGPIRMISKPRLVRDARQHRLWLVADAGSGDLGIRDDFGGHDVLVAAIRTQ